MTDPAVTWADILCDNLDTRYVSQNYARGFFNHNHVSLTRMDIDMPFRLKGVIPEPTWAVLLALGDTHLTPEETFCFMNFDSYKLNNPIKARTQPEGK